ncbi:hypothetical protein [Streptomyces fragilis]|uniref:DUF2637 domain-containing protein n=1 Tax=Streptomyces fragilis TaxID=67301 RepID=A0ABV2YC77_9ACTN|nr:hypothetical protein [Streptomyces fragilis]
MTPLALPFDVGLDLSTLLTVGVPTAAAALGLTGWALLRRRKAGPPPASSSSSLAVKMAALAALGCTAYSADTSWRFAEDYLNIAGTAERVAMFASAELALFATALMARQNMTTQGAPGVPGTLVWIITSVQVIPAYAESGLVGGTVRAFVGPVMAATLWHLAMGIELRLKSPGTASRSLLATLGREARERLLSRLGIAVRDRDAAQITRDRATQRAVALATRLAELSPEQRARRRGRRLTRRLSKAIGQAAVGTDAVQRAQLLEQLAARRHALALATVPLPSPWSPERDMTGPVPSTPTGTVPVEQPVPRLGPHPYAVPGGDRSPAIEAPGRGLGEGTESPDGRISDRGSAAVEAARDRGLSGTDRGTDTTGDRGPTNTNPGTDTTRDRGPVPLRRKPNARSKDSSRSNGRSRAARGQRPSPEVMASVEELTEQVRPHVQELLERDGNEAITRVQLREILRREGLSGGRNDRLGLVLQELRKPTAGSTTTRRSAR